MRGVTSRATLQPGAKSKVWLLTASAAARIVLSASSLAFLLGVLIYGQKAGWVLPKFSVLLGVAEASTQDDWCGDHAVPESLCVECDKSLAPAGPPTVWCSEHGLPVCPLCKPDLAQVKAVSAEDDRARATKSLAFAPRGENAKRCKLHERRLQFASAEIVTALGIGFTPARRGPVEEFVTAPGEISYDPAGVARVSARVPGTVVRVTKNVGDDVAAGEVLAVVDAPDVGKSKAEFLQTAAAVEVKRNTLAGLQAMAGAVPEKALRTAEAEYEEAFVRFLTAEQVLANLGVTPSASSGNELSVVAPFAGKIVARTATPGEQTDPSRPLLTVASTARMLVTLGVRLEDAERVRAGQSVMFRQADDDAPASGTVTWVSPAADPTTRTVPVRIELPNANGKSRANTTGTATILLRTEPNAVLVPASAVHWEGDCHVVFVRDLHFDDTGGPKLLHVRKVRVAARNAASVEVIGVLPGEFVAAANSGVLRSELLKNGLGDGCGCHDH